MADSWHFMCRNILYRSISLILLLRSVSSLNIFHSDRNAYREINAFRSIINSNMHFDTFIHHGCRFGFSVFYCILPEFYETCFCNGKVWRWARNSSWCTPWRNSWNKRTKLVLKKKNSIFIQPWCVSQCSRVRQTFFLIKCRLNALCCKRETYGQKRKKLVFIQQ